MPPLVSVVLPTHNRAGTLSRAIKSVLNQTFKDFELIVVDDHSDDETPLVLREYLDGDWVTSVPSPRRGCAAARNVGVALSRGRYVAFQDSDDEWLPNKLEKAVLALEEAGPQFGVFHSEMILVEPDGNTKRFATPHVEQGVLMNERTLDYAVYGIGIQSAVIRRECFDKAGLFDEDLKRFSDLDLFIRLSQHYRFIHCREPLVRYYRTTDALTNDRQALVRARRHLLEKYRSRLEERRHHVAMQYFHLAVALRGDHEFLKSIALTVKALMTSHAHPQVVGTVLAALQAQAGAMFFRLRPRS